jgi:hypothetical protein
MTCFGFVGLRLRSRFPAFVRLVHSCGEIHRFAHLVASSKDAAPVKRKVALAVPHDALKGRQNPNALETRVIATQARSPSSSSGW